MPSTAKDLRGTSSPIASRLHTAKEAMARLEQGCSFQALSAEQFQSMADPAVGCGAFHSMRANTAPQPPATSSGGDERDFVELTISVQRNQPSAEMTDDLRQLTTATATARAGGLTPAMAYAAQWKLRTHVLQGLAQQEKGGTMGAVVREGGSS